MALNVGNNSFGINSLWYTIRIFGLVVFNHSGIWRSFWIIKNILLTHGQHFSIPLNQYWVKSQFLILSSPKAWILLGFIHPLETSYCLYLLNSYCHCWSWSFKYVTTISILSFMVKPSFFIFTLYHKILELSKFI